MNLEKHLIILGYIGKALEKYLEDFPNIKEEYHLDFLKKGLIFESTEIDQFDILYRLCTQLKFEQRITDFKINVSSQKLSVCLEW